MPRKLEKSIVKARKSMPERGLGALGGDLGKKKFEEAVLADFGQIWTGAGCAKWRQDRALGAHLGARMGEDGAKMALCWPTWRLRWPTWCRFGVHF